MKTFKTKIEFAKDVEGAKGVCAKFRYRIEKRKQKKSNLNSRNVFIKEPNDEESRKNAFTNRCGNIYFG